MKRIRTILACALLAACSVSVIACSGALSDGGQSGSGIAAIRGDVVAVTGAGGDVADIRVSLAATDLATRTDGDGRFELRGKVSGPAELRFERERDGLLARTDVVIPAGGVLELEQIMIDSDSGEARPTRQRVELEGIVEALDCTAGTILITPKDDDPAATVFTVEVASATIHHDGVPLACGDLRVGDRVQVHAETSDGSTLVNADIELEDREDGPDDNPDDQNVEIEGIVGGLDCIAGTILVTPKDDDPAATVFTVEAASATIHHDGVLLACGDLRVGDRVQVHAETSDGSTLVNADIELEDREDGPDDNPDDQNVEIEGIVGGLDCTAGTILVTPKDDDPAATVFTVEVASATIHHDGVPLACGDLRVGDRVQVHAETSDGSTLVNADIELEDREDGPDDNPDDQNVEIEGIVGGLDCTAGTILVTPKDDDPAATVFTVEAASATIHHDGVLLACGDLRVGDRVQVQAETSDGSTLVNAEIELEDREDGPGDDAAEESGDNSENEPMPGSPETDG